MKVNDIISEVTAREINRAVQNLGDRAREMDLRGRLTDEHFELAFKAVRGDEKTKEEISDLATELSEHEKYGRSKASADFILNRMHILVHGVAPHGETERRAETMFTIPKTMIEFANKKGLDTDFNIEHAREELRNRPARIKRPEAMKVMSDYYMKNKDSLPKDIRQHRDAIITDLMTGQPPEKVFAKYS